MALRQLGEPIEDYDGLISLIRSRLAELQVTCEAASALAGLTETHISKLINPRRTRLLARMSLTVILQTLGLKLIAVTDDEAYAPLRERLPRSTFNRWGRPRELGVRVDDVGGEKAVRRVPELLAAVTVPIVERPKPAPAVLRPKIPPRGLAFGPGHRKSRPGVSVAA